MLRDESSPIHEGHDIVVLGAHIISFSGVPRLSLEALVKRSHNADTYPRVASLIPGTTQVTCPRQTLTHALGKPQDALGVAPRSKKPCNRQSQPSWSAPSLLTAALKILESLPRSHTQRKKHHPQSTHPNTSWTTRDSPDALNTHLERPLRYFPHAFIEP